VTLKTPEILESQCHTASVNGALESAVDVKEDAGNGRAKQHKRSDNHDGDQGDDQGVLNEALATAAAAGRHVHRKILQT
jgi:hypothetical protein